MINLRYKDTIEKSIIKITGKPAKLEIIVGEIEKEEEKKEEENIEAMLASCHKGPALSRVDSVEFIVGRRSCFLPPIEEGIFKRA